jgi:hypothetical protein
MVNMTLAETWRKRKPETFKTIEAYFDLLKCMDPKAKAKLTDLGAVIIFSDGSIHRMGK